MWGRPPRPSRDGEAEAVVDPLPSVGEQKTKIKRDEIRPQIECGPGQPPETAFVRGFLLCLVTARRRNDRFSPTALQRSAAFAKASCRFVILRSRSCNRCGGQRPCLAPRSRGGGGRNARATSRACAQFLECPPAIHPRESPAAAGSAAIIRQAQELSRFAEPTLRQIVAPRNTKKSCRLCRNCGG